MFCGYNNLKKNKLSEKLPETPLDADNRIRYKEKHMYLCITS